MTRTAPLSLICALSRNRVIGLRNDLPWHIPADLRHFKTLTENKPVLMGRLTYESILGRRNGKPLPGRPHYVVGTQLPSAPLPPAVRFFGTIDDAIDAAATDYPNTEIMVIGGAKLYAQAIDRVDKMYLTMIDATIEGDAYFPEFSSEDWTETAREDVSATEDTPAFSFVTYVRR